MRSDMLIDKGFKFVAKGYKPLCATENGLLTYHNHALYLYKDNAFEKLLRFPVSIKNRMLSYLRVLERMTRSEPQSAVVSTNDVFVACRHEVLQVSLKDGSVIDKHNYRKNYIHTNRLSMIKNIEGFSDCVVYGEYQPNVKREEVFVWRKKTLVTNKWECVYKFSEGQIRHIHAIIPDRLHRCVYILTGDEDKESGIWKATDDFKKVEPLLVGNQAYRSCIAYVDGEELCYSTDIPSRQNTITRVDLNTMQTEALFDLPGSSTVGCRCREYKIFCTSVETKEPKTRGKTDMIRYLFGRKLPAGIKDRFPRVYVYLRDRKIEEWLKFEKDIWPAGLFRFGRAIPLYDEFRNRLYLYPGAVKKYDGKLYFINIGEIYESIISIK